MQQLLLLEDDVELARLTKDYLSSNGFGVEVVHQGAGAIELVLRKQPDLLILDLMLPGMDGLEICRQVKAKSQQKILILTAKSDDLDQILGLELGADDYVCKPVDPRLLLAKIKALLRRHSGSGKLQQRLEFDQLAIDKSQRAVFLRQQAIDVNAQEFDLLWCLASHAGEVLTRDQIYRQVRGFEYDGCSRFVDITISHLRQKLAQDESAKARIKTIFGKGYLFVPSTEQNS